MNSWVSVNDGGTDLIGHASFKFTSKFLVFSSWSWSLENAVDVHMYYHCPSGLPSKDTSQGQIWWVSLHNIKGSSCVWFTLSRYEKNHHELHIAAWKSNAFSTIVLNNIIQYSRNDSKQYALNNRASSVGSHRVEEQNEDHDDLMASLQLIFIIQSPHSDNTFISRKTTAVWHDMSSLTTRMSLF